jgi:oligosaccharide repeat unit polymerase
MLLFILTLLSLALLNYFLVRSLLYPPFVFCLLWAAALLGLYITGDLFYPVTPKTLSIYLVGSIAFTAGGLSAMIVKLRSTAGTRETPRPPAFLPQLLDLGLLIALACLPLLWQNLEQAFHNGSLSAISQQLRADAMEKALNLADGSLNAVVSLTPVFSVLAFVALFEYCRSGNRRRRTYAAILLAVIYNLASTSRSQVLILLIGLLSILWVHFPQRAKKVGLVAGIMFCIFAAANQIQLEKDGARSGAPLSENLHSIGEGFAKYAFGGLVAFDISVQHPGRILNNWKLYTFFIRTLNKFGMNIEAPPVFLEYVDINRAVDINVYTIYFAYYSDYGYTGTVLLLFILGFVTTLTFRKARLQNPIAVLLLGPAFYGILMTVFAEAFFMEMGFWLKILACGYFLYVFVPRFFPRERLVPQYAPA